jgi:hypothetical protein
MVWVQRRANGWTTKGSGLNSRWGQEIFCLLYRMKPNSIAYSASYLTGVRGKLAEA